MDFNGEFVGDYPPASSSGQQQQQYHQQQPQQQQYQHQYAQQQQQQQPQPPTSADMNVPDMYSLGMTADTFDDPHFQFPSFLNAPPRGPETMSAFISSSSYYQQGYGWGDPVPLKPSERTSSQFYAPAPSTSQETPYTVSMPADSREGHLIADPPPPVSSISANPPPGTAAPLLPPSTPTLGLSIYSESGFDMVGILGRVASRPNPQVVLGPVDFTCSFVVADAQNGDEPIVYASPTFSELTGYEMSEIVGRNCRFLQAPSGSVRKGETRKFTDEKAVSHIRKSLDTRSECQVSFINYRKNGESFINLVTIIPIKWDGDDYRFLVGFQVDLERQPGAVLRTMPDGTLSVNYSTLNHEGRMDGSERYPPISSRLNAILSEGGATLSSEQARQQLNSMILSHSDDFIHVLSLKGSIQYVSPSVIDVLEYTPEELHGKTISDITHPSDQVPVMRELKESSTNPQPTTNVTSDILAQRYRQQAKLIHLLFRIRRKNSGYVWIESTGRLQIEQGKGRKTIVFSGRIRRMPGLTWQSIASGGGLADPECWGHISVHGGLFLVASTGVLDILGRSADHVLGTRVHDWVDPVYHAAIDQALDEVRSGVALPRPKQVICLRLPSLGYPSQPIAIAFHPLDNPTSANYTNRGLRQSSIICHIRLAQNHGALFPPLHPSVNPSSVQDYLRAPPLNAAPQGLLATSRIAHELTSNVFEELETTRTTSWQYELQQLRIINQNLQDEVNAATTGGAQQVPSSIPQPSSSSTN